MHGENWKFLKVSLLSFRFPIFPYPVVGHEPYHPVLIDVEWNPPLAVAFRGGEVEQQRHVLARPEII